jgi:hypothetical protein
LQKLPEIQQEQAKKSRTRKDIEQLECSEADMYKNFYSNSQEAQTNMFTMIEEEILLASREIIKSSNGNLVLL